MSWQKEELNEVVDIINGGAWTQKEFVDSGVPVIKVSNLTSNGIDNNGMSYLPIEFLDKNSKYVLNAGDIVITTVGSHPQLVDSAAGRGFVIPQEYQGALLNQNIVCLRTKSESKLNPKYLCYVCLSYGFRNFIQQNGRGAANQMRIPISGIKRYKIELPSLSIQKKIASILSAYDDLIENNLKRIKLLEEAAQNVYKEWFVHFRFPEHEKVKMDKEIGLPEGWERKEMHMIGDVVTGKTPSTKKKEYYGNDVPFIKTPDMHKAIFMQKVEQYLSHDGADSQRTKYLPMNTVIVACIGAKAGVVAITATKSQTNQQINAIKSFKDFTYIWLYYTCISLKKYLISLGSSGATMTNVSKGKFENIKVNYPPEDLLQEFQNVCKPIFNQILCLQKYNLELKEARDILLPRLMNQTIRV
jgi:type I restriction enzyme S subunit